jgi:hypothetical protein
MNPIGAEIELDSWTVEAGTFRLTAGPSSAELPLSTHVAIAPES